MRIAYYGVEFEFVKFIVVELIHAEADCARDG